MHKLLNIARRLLSREQRRFIKFCVVGASGVPVNLAFTWVGFHLVFAALSPDFRRAGAFLLGIGVSVFTNFLLNDLWTWGDRGRAGRSFAGRLGRFYLVSSAAAGLQFGTAMTLSLWLHFHYLMAQLFGIALAMFANFVVNNVWTFRGDGGSAPDEEEEEDMAEEASPAGGASRATRRR